MPIGPDVELALAWIKWIVIAILMGAFLLALAKLQDAETPAGVRVRNVVIVLAALLVAVSAIDIVNQLF